MSYLDDLIQSLESLNSILKHSFFNGQDIDESINYIKTDNEELSTSIQPLKKIDSNKKVRIVKTLVSLNKCTGNIMDGLKNIQENLNLFVKNNKKNDA